MAILSKKTFLNEANATTTSEAMMNINVGSSLVLEFTGSASTFTAQVEAIVGDYNDNGWTALKVVNLGTYSASNTISDKGIYMTGVEGMVKIRVKLTAVSGGGVTCVGKLAG